MKATSITLALVVVAVLLVLGYIKFFHDPQVRREAALRTSNDSLNAALEDLTAREDARATRDTALTREVAALRARARSGSAHADTLIIRASILDTVFVAQLPDSLKVQFREIVAHKDAAIEALHGVIADLHGALEGQDAQLALRDTSLAETRAALAEAIRQRDSWRKQARPSFVIRLLRDAPKVVLGFGLGWLATR